MQISLYITLLLIHCILGQPDVENPNIREFIVKIDKSWNQQKEYDYLFNVASIEQAMELTVYQANTNPYVPIMGRHLAVDEDASVSYEFTIPTDWTQRELELRITLIESGQIILRRFTLRSNKPEQLFETDKDLITEIDISILSEGRLINDLIGNINEKIGSSAINDLRMRKDACELQAKVLVQLLQDKIAEIEKSKKIAEEEFDTFYIAQVVREYGWLMFYLTQSYARILTEYLKENNLHTRLDIGYMIIALDKALKLYGPNLLKQQNLYLVQRQAFGDYSSSGILKRQGDNNDVDMVLNGLETAFSEQLGNVANPYAKLPIFSEKQIKVLMRTLYESKRNGAASKAAMAINQAVREQLNAAGGSNSSWTWTTIGCRDAAHMFEGFRPFSLEQIRQLLHTEYYEKGVRDPVKVSKIINHAVGEPVLDWRKAQSVYNEFKGVVSNSISPHQPKQVALRLGNPVQASLPMYDGAVAEQQRQALRKRKPELHGSWLKLGPSSPSVDGTVHSERASSKKSKKLAGKSLQLFNSDSNEK